MQRRNPKKPSTASERRAYGGGYERTFGGGKPTTARRKAAAKSPASKEADAKRRSKRETVFRRAKRSGVSDTASAKRAMREVPFLKGQTGSTFHGQSAYTGKAVKAKAPAQYAKRKVTVVREVKVKRKVTKTSRTRVAYGRFKRLRIRDPKTGRMKMSMMYRDSKTGRYRKIPAYAIAGASSPKAYESGKYDKKKTTIRKRRATKARKVMKRGGAFTPNPRRKTTAMATSTKRSRAAKKGWAKRRRSAPAKRTTRTTRTARKRTYKRNAAPKTRTTTARRTVRRNAAKRGTTTRKRTMRRNTTAKRTVRRNTTAKRTVRRNTTAKRTVRRNTHKTVRRNPGAITKRKSAKRVAAGKKAYRTRKRREGAGYGKKRGRRGVTLKRGKIYYSGARPRRLKGVQARRLPRPKSRVYLTNRRRKAKRSVTKRRTYRRNTGLRLRRNGAMAAIGKAFNTGLAVTVGFVGHKALTHAICTNFIAPLLARKAPPTAPPENGAPEGGEYGNGTAKNGVQGAVKIGCGLAVAILGTMAVSKVVSRERTAQIGGGMYASWMHTILMTALDMGGEGGAKVKPYLSGYDTQSTAAAIGRYRRRRGTSGMRGMRGMGNIRRDRATTSILPQYAPTGTPGGIQQAVANSTGEYFGASGVGEYFAAGVEGIGQYEPAGPLVTQAAAGMGQVIDEGIMPGDADAALTLAEAQAGTGQMPPQAAVNGMRGLGEFYSARPQNGQYQDYRVPTSSQWIPSGPLWAGKQPAANTVQTSEVPAGILESASGNGIF